MFKLQNYVINIKQSKRKMSILEILKENVNSLYVKYIKDDKIRTDTLIRDEVKQAIFDNGAIAIGILSPNEEILYTGDNWKLTEEKMDKEKIINQINLCDGIVLQGGSTSEVYESFIAKYCYENNIPCLGICAGQNNIVRALGGTTYEIPNPEKHDKLNEKYVHSVHIDKTSKFYNIVEKDFYIGIRFHPESLYKFDDNMNKIFKKFIEACKK